MKIGKYRNILWFTTALHVYSERNKEKMIFTIWPLSKKIFTGWEKRMWVNNRRMSLVYSHISFLVEQRAKFWSLEYEGKLTEIDYLQLMFLSFHGPHNLCVCFLFRFFGTLRQTMRYNRVIKGRQISESCK